MRLPLGESFFTPEKMGLAALLGGDVHDVHQPGNELGTQIAPGLYLLTLALNYYLPGRGEAISLTCSEPVRPGASFESGESESRQFSYVQGTRVPARGTVAYAQAPPMELIHTDTAHYRIIPGEVSERQTERSVAEFETLLGNQSGSATAMSIALLSAVHPLINRLENQPSFMEGLHFPPLRQGELRVLETSIKLYLHSSSIAQFNEFSLHSGIDANHPLPGRKVQTTYRASSPDQFTLDIGLTFLPKDLAKRLLSPR